MSHRGREKSRAAKIVEDLATEMDETAKWLRGRLRKDPGAAIVAGRLERLSREAMLAIREGE